MARRSHSRTSRGYPSSIMYASTSVPYGLNTSFKLRDVEGTIARANGILYIRVPHYVTPAEWHFSHTDLFRRKSPSISDWRDGTDGASCGSVVV